MSFAERLRGAWGTGSRHESDPRRWVFVDVETSGLDAHRDRLIALAAIALHWRDGASGLQPRIVVSDSFEAVLRQDDARVDKPNILLHGIGVGAQRVGLEPRSVLEAFEGWLGTAPLIAFHSAFDETMIARAMRSVLGRRLPNAWLDLAPLASVLLPEVKAHALDEWIGHFGLRCAVRHQAAADTLVTAELFLRLWPLLRRHAGESPDFRGLQRLAGQKRWLVQ